MISAIAGEGSGRRYYRVNGPDGTFIATVGTSVRENDAFIYLSDYFNRHNLPVPSVRYVSDDRLSYLQTDLGDTSLFSMIAGNEADSQDVKLLLIKIMEILPRFHYCVDRSFDSSKCFPRERMDERAVLWDLNYFKYSFLKPSGINFDEDRLEDDFSALSADVAKNPENTLMLRDFQSRNVMINKGVPCVIDFQGARMGDGLYDVASFVWQSRAGFPDELKSELVSIYRSSVVSLTGRDIPDFDERLRLMVLMRQLQTLGAYGFRGYFERKARFVETIPAAVASLRKTLDSFRIDSSPYPYLLTVLQKLVSLNKYKYDSMAPGLTVTVMSFSYKKGFPDDYSGNGGGFVFDCRGMHNPGRYDEYKPLTGRDDAVIEFLERQGEVRMFMENCYGLVDPTVECYMRRGFSSLMVCFGCTGGRHRSVYGAEHLARHLNQKYGVRVRLIHREQNMTLELK